MIARSTGLRSANLNLIPVLRALLREVSVTRAGVSLGLSPSAVSCALAELRLMMSDPLLVRVGRTMRLTPRAEQLIPKLEQACLVLEDLLHEDAFQRETASRTFVLAMLDYLSLLLGPVLAKRLEKIAPGVQIRFVDVPGDLERRLAKGTVDLGLLAVSHLDWVGVSTGPTCRDRVVGVVDARHPLARLERVTEADLAAFPAVAWEAGLDLSDRLAASGLATRVPALPSPRIKVQSYCAIPMMLIGADTVTALPEALARRLALDLPLHWFELPGRPIVFETGALWSSVQDADPAHRWFRAHVIEALADVHRQVATPPEASPSP